MKNIITALSTSWILFSSAQLQAQNVYAIKNGDSVTFSKDTVAKLKSFWAKCYSGKVYLQWAVTNLRHDGVFLIYRSSDGKNFEMIGKKNAVGVPISKEIVYYFNYKPSCFGNKTYKIVYVNMTEFFASEEINMSISKEAYAAKGR